MHNKNTIVCVLWLTSNDKILSMLKERFIPSHVYNMCMCVWIGMYFTTNKIKYLLLERKWDIVIKYVYVTK